MNRNVFSVVNVPRFSVKCDITAERRRNKRTSGLNNPSAAADKPERQSGGKNSAGSRSAGQSLPNPAFPNFGDNFIPRRDKSKLHVGFIWKHSVSLNQRSVFFEREVINTFFQKNHGVRIADVHGNNRKNAVEHGKGESFPDLCGAHIHGKALAAAR